MSHKLMDKVLYCLAGDLLLVLKGKEQSEPIIPGWWQPSDYNRELHWAPLSWVPGPDEAIIEPLGTPPADPAVGRYRWFSHISYDAEQGLSANVFYKARMILHILYYFLVGHP